MKDTTFTHGTQATKEKPLVAFDFDGTLVKPREGRQFPTDVDDWRFLRQSVPRVLRETATTHRIAILTDQTKPWKLKQIETVLAAIGIPAVVVVGGVTKKPDVSWIRTALRGETPAFFVGDAAGRPGDWSDCDRKTAEALGCPFRVPEEMFPADPPVVRLLEPTESPEVVVFVGYPGSGKTTLARTLGSRYVRIDGDEYPSPVSMVRVARRVPVGSSIIFDSTGGTVSRRRLFREFAAERGLPVRIVWITTSMEQAMDWNATRPAPVPAVAFYVFRKSFEPPTEEEGALLLIA